MLRNIFVVAQVATFIGLGVVLFSTGSWKLGGAQVLLGIVTVLVYSA